MALELLSGPHDVVDINDGSTPLALRGGVYGQWVDPLGLVLEVSVLGLAVVQMDGSGCVFSEFPNNTSFGLSLLGASTTDPLLGERWYSYHGYASSGSAPEYELNRITHSIGRVLNASGAASVLNPYARLGDRYLRALGSAVRTFTTDASATTVERAIPGMSNAQNLSWAREAGCLWVGSTGGLLTLYDYVAKVERGALYHLGMSCSGLWYSRKHDVFVSLHSAGGGLWQTRVWARTVRPVSVSAPVAESTLQAGRVVSLKCRVLGDAGEPCEGEVVTWLLAEGAGSCAPLTSLTDAQGWARTNYTVPLGATGLAGVEVEVNV